MALAPFCHGRTAQCLRHLSFQPDRIVQQQTPTAPYFDAISQKTTLYHLAHRCTAEHKALHAQKPGVVGKFNAQARGSPENASCSTLRRI